MTFDLCKLGLQQANLTLAMVFSCLFVDTCGLCFDLFRIINIYVLGKQY